MRQLKADREEAVSWRGWSNASAAAAAAQVTDFFSARPEEDARCAFNRTAQAWSCRYRTAKPTAVPAAPVVPVTL